MGLTKASVGKNAAQKTHRGGKLFSAGKTVALAGNPNVGKSTVFNGLTGMHQHTGNWPGKTVTNAVGYFGTKKNTYKLVDLPGTYSLSAHSAEEEIARNFICFENPDAVIVVCDATCLERNLNLVLQTLEITKKVIVCVNLMDEAKRKGISVDMVLLSKRLGVPVVSSVAQKKKSLRALSSSLDLFSEKKSGESLKINYGTDLENAISAIEPYAKKLCENKISSRWLSLRLLDSDLSLQKEIENYLGIKLCDESELCTAVSTQLQILEEKGITADKIKDIIVSSVFFEAESICEEAVIKKASGYGNLDRRLDRLFTGRLAGFPIMLLLMCFIFWLTITGANYPSQLLSSLLFSLEGKLHELMTFLNAPQAVTDALVFGVFRVLSWVVSVMLPPMMVFFPLFTLLEDSGYLPRIAYNLDKPFRCCNACGKQALTMCMGFGCNAAGVVGCRIIDSPRERLLAILTNSFVPCNGRFPILIAIISMFFIGTQQSLKNTFLSALLVTITILLGIVMTFLATKLLSVTSLKGQPSSFTLEMPPYRKPQIGKVLVRSIFDRTLFVLGRAVCVAAPAGLIIWLMANSAPGGVTLLSRCSTFLDPFARLMGLDGVILIAFILGLPANEIVIPIIIMAYMAQGHLTELESISEMKALFVSHGWTVSTAVSVLIFTLLHWPCSTTLITIKKETGSLKWTALAAILPTVIGAVLCILVNLVSHII